MKIGLQDIPQLVTPSPHVWKVKALTLDDRCPVLATLLEWKRSHPKAFKAIMKVMVLVAQQKRVRNPKHVKKNGNPEHGDVYEMLAYGGVARVMFFYDARRESLIVCTNAFVKGDGDQDAAFRRCAEMKRLYVRSTPDTDFGHE